MNKTEAYAFSGRITLGSTFGVSLAATTGCSKQVEVRYVYTARGFACGTKSYPLRDTARGVIADTANRGNR